MKLKIGLIIIGIVILVGGIFAYFKFFNEEPEEPDVKANIIDTIESFGYSLNDRDCKAFKDEFNNLKNILKDEIDYKEYAISLSKLFVIDFYTLDSKINKYDIGGVEFVHPKIKDNFELKAIDTIYKYVEDNSHNKRKQDLPEVKSISIEENDMESTYLIDGKETEAITVSVKWDYIKDYGYDSSGIITFVKDEKKLVIVDFEVI